MAVVVLRRRGAGDDPRRGHLVVCRGIEGTANCWGGGGILTARLPRVLEPLALSQRAALCARGVRQPHLALSLCRVRAALYYPGGAAGTDDGGLPHGRGWIGRVRRRLRIAGLERQDRPQAGPRGHGDSLDAAADFAFAAGALSAPLSARLSPIPFQHEPGDYGRGAGADPDR